MNGKTMIATDIPGVNEVVNSGNGILVPAEDPQALAQAIKKLAEDPEKRASLAARAKRDYDNKCWCLGRVQKPLKCVLW